MARILGLVLGGLAVVSCGPTQDEATGLPSGSQLVISPEDPTVVSKNGVSTPVDFTATLVFPDGRREPATGVSWAIASVRLGSIDPAGACCSPAIWAITISQSFKTRSRPRHVTTCSLNQPTAIACTTRRTRKTR